MIDRYALDVRTALDIAHHGLTRLGVDDADRISMVSPDERLFEDFARRLPVHVQASQEDPNPVAVYLFAVESGTPLPHPGREKRVILVFRNTYSHKSFVHRQPGVGFYPLERRLLSGYQVVGRWGVFGPRALGLIVLGAMAERLRWFRLSFLLQDRAYLSLLSQGRGRYLCGFGVLALRART